ncbi:hypothetical protein SKAU_G00165860 [Synaphobranchus kaupii]|uniref:Uncharacterized protein n=1 Tax=Synaphobranchus kaupii TaxID=118154 RepID=A0A9Q1IZB9_SYNKA|nr:hypothetical protein SKAU_G00165860 [Synaphobranchus kaupii]
MLSPKRMTYSEASAVQCADNTVWLQPKHNTASAKICGRGAPKQDGTDYITVLPRRQNTLSGSSVLADLFPEVEEGDSTPNSFPAQRCPKLTESQRTTCVPSLIMDDGDRRCVVRSAVERLPWEREKDLAVCSPIFSLAYAKDGRRLHRQPSLVFQEPEAMCANRLATTATGRHITLPTALLAVYTQISD